MRSVGIFEAKTKLAELCDEVAHRHETIIITRRGKPVARLVPLEADARADTWTLVRDYHERYGRPEVDFEPPARQPDPIRDYFRDDD